MDRMEAVSYTHLDVYKRQSQLSEEIGQLKLPSSDGKLYKTDVATTQQPVSYTHLMCIRDRVGCTAHLCGLKSYCLQRYIILPLFANLVSIISIIAR